MRPTICHEPTGLFESLEPRKLLSTGLGGGEALPFTYYYPEGYAHDGISEFVPITNPGAEEVRFELHARYETGERDQVVASGVIPAGTRGGVTVNTAGDAAGRLVRPDTPYALVLKTSGPVGATMSHYDFGTAVGESFTAATSTEWTFAEGYKDSDWTRDFVVLYNTSDDDCVVTLTAYTGDGEMITATTTVGAQRRGGWSLDDDSRLPDGVFGIRLVASRPIVAALSHYEIVTGRGFGAIGTADGGALAGVITAIDFDDDNRRHGGDDDNSGPGSGGDDDDDDDNSGPGGGGDDDDDDDDDDRRGDDGSGGPGDDDGTPDQGPGDAPGTPGSGGSTDDDGTPDQGPGDFGGSSSSSSGLYPANAYITILNTNTADATVTLTFISEDDDVPLANNVRVLTVPAQSRGGVSVRDLGFPVDDEFGVVYRSDIKVTVTAAVYEGRDAVGVQAVDAAATEWKFGEGFMSRLRAGRGVTEDVYLFNPTAQHVVVRIDFFFSTGQSITIFEDLDPLELDDEDLHVMAGILDAGMDVFYGIKVTSPVPIVATFEHWDDDLGGGFATPGTPGGTIVSLADVLVI